MRKKRLLVNWKAREKNTEKKQIEHITNEKRKLIRNIIKEIFPQVEESHKYKLGDVRGSSSAAGF